MPGARNTWCRRSSCSSASHAAGRSRPVDANYAGEWRARYGFDDGAGEIGFISSVTQPFCGACTRARLSADGVLYSCLFAPQGIDLRQPLRAGASDEELCGVLQGFWKRRDDRYSELRCGGCAPGPRPEMHRLGG